MRPARAVAAPALAVLLCAAAVAAVVLGAGRHPDHRARTALEGDDDFSTADRGMDWSLDAPSKAEDGSKASWYAAGSRPSLAAGASGDLDGPSASDASAASWAAAGTYDPNGLAKGDPYTESGQLLQLKKTLMAHGAYRRRRR
eukprot:Tamp_36978.p2 GENE.Tamp_36978~~Tamp_36978.p2  ORF type:complete len:143 (+),score=26.29 Tamp_36978:12-440(+)